MISNKILDFLWILFLTQPQNLSNISLSFSKNTVTHIDFYYLDGVFAKTPDKTQIKISFK